MYNPMMGGMGAMGAMGGMGMMGGMGGMGMNPMFSGYRTYNFNPGFRLGTYGITRMHIDMYARQLFMKYDYNMSGQLNVMELYPLMCEFFMMSGLGYPNQMDVMYLMNMFDMDGSGTIDYFEFEMMLEMLSGRSMNPMMLRQYRMNRGMYADNWRGLFGW